MDTAAFLVLDDELAVRDSIERLTKRRRLPVRLVSVASARDATFVLAQRAAIAGMLLDVFLPDGNGFDVLSWARAQPAHQTTPALLMTGAPDVSMFNRAYDLRAEMITKPFDLDEGLERVVRFFTQGASLDDVPPTLEGCVRRLREFGKQYPDARTRYAVGMIVAALKSQPERYGANAVSTAARELGEPVPSFYRHATVAACWTVAQFEALLTRRGPDGFSLSWSHLVILASIEPLTARERLIAKALAEKLSVRDLQTMADAARVGGL